MLKKLLKYDLKDAFNKVIIIYATLSLVLAGAYRLFALFDEILIWEVVAKICFGASISMAVTLIINIIIHAWVNFTQNVYGDRGYLTHTLPIPKRTIYTSKLLSVMICLLIAVLVSALSLFILLYSGELLEILEELSVVVSGAYQINLYVLVLVIVLEIFLQFLATIQMGLVGIILGHRMQSAKRGFSFLYGGIAYLLSQGVALVGLLAVAFVNDDFMRMLFTASNTMEASLLKTVMLCAIVIYAIINLIGYFVAVKLFNKGVNID